MYVIVIAAVTFAVLFLLDKLFGKIFRAGSSTSPGSASSCPSAMPLPGCFWGFWGCWC